MEDVLMINVITIEKDGKIKRKQIDHNNREDRRWLGKHCFWAFRNGATVITAKSGDPTKASTTRLSDLFEEV